MYHAHRVKVELRRNLWKYLRCGAKLITFIFWASLYMLVMKLTIFKSQTNEPAHNSALLTDNYTKWLLNGPVLGDDSEKDQNTLSYNEYPDNKTTYELEQRARKVQKVCRSRGISTKEINSKEFFVDHKHMLIWCNIFKAASSSWLYKFNILGGYDRLFLARSRHNPLTLARKKFPRPSEEELRDAINNPGVVSLLVVREPFVRLLSAYRDKLENAIPPYYRKLAKSIKSKYRLHNIKLSGTAKPIGPTFYQFVSYLIEKHDGPHDTSAFDEHWAPYYKFCSPCAVNFSVVAKVETLARDSAYVVSELGLGHMIGPRVTDRRTRLRTVMNKSRDGKKTSALLRYYFSQLDKRMLDDLLNIYGVDFEMFGYDPTIYYKYVRN